MNDDDATAGTTVPAGGPTSRWVVVGQVVLTLGLVAVFVVVYQRSHSPTRITDARVLATCTATAESSYAPVTADLDTSACSDPPTAPLTARGAGWSVVTFALPSSLGLQPRINGAYADSNTRLVRLDYDTPVDESRREGGQAPTVTLVFVEVPTSKLPSVPFTVDGTTGPVTATAVPDAR